jgi:phage repressor protein C with HTH and peptisase S24 domain
VVVKTKEGEVLAKELKRKTARTLELKSLNAEHPDRSFDLDQIAWMARVMWATQ